MSFREIRGHGVQIGILKRALGSGRLRGAYLFWGPPGIGKRKVAFVVAKALNCASLDDDSCNRCISCLKIDHGNHPDVYRIKPEKDKQQILIGQIREIQRRVSFHPSEATHRVLIVEEADRMNLSAANCFLKLLEEPPLDMVMILLSPGLYPILPTIASRCQKIKFNPLPTREIIEVLKEIGGIGEDRARLLASLSDGSVGKAMEMMENPLLEERHLLIRRLLAERGPSEKGPLGLAQELLSKSTALPPLLEMLGSLYRDMLVYSETGDPGRLANRDISDAIMETSERYSPVELVSILEALIRAKYRLSRNANKELILEWFLMTCKDPSFPWSRDDVAISGTYMEDCRFPADADRLW